MIQTGARNHELLDLFTLIPAFARLDDATQHQLARIARYHHFDAKSTILNQGELSPCMFLVAVGLVKVSRLSRTGREHILNLLSKGNTFNDVTILDEGPNPATAVAHTDCGIWYFSSPAMIELASRQPDLALALARNVSNYSRYLVQEVDGLSMCSVKARLARFLLNQSNGHDAVQLLWTQEEIASHLGTVREMIGRTLRTLKIDGVIQYQSESIRILDRDRLVGYAEF